MLRNRIRGGRLAQGAGLAVAIALLTTACWPEDNAASRDVAEVGRSNMLPADDSGEPSIYGSYLAGQFAERRSNLDLAATLIGRVLADSPDNKALLRRAFILSLGAGQGDKAAEFAKKLTDAGSGLSIAALLLTARDLKAGRLEVAKKNLAAMKDDGFERYPKLLAKAWLGVVGKQYDAAIAVLETLAKEKGFEILGGLHAGFVEEIAGRPDAAERRYRKLAKDPKKASTRLLRSFAALLQRKGKQAEALKLLAAKLEQTPSSLILEDAVARLKAGKPLPRLVNGPVQGLAEGIFNLASALPRDRAENIVLLYARIALDLVPNFDLVHLLVGDILGAREQYEQAIAVYGKVNPDTAYSWSARLRTADALYELERLDDAAKYLEAMSKEQPQRTDALLKLGNFMRYKEKFDKAVDAYDRAFKRLGDPNKEQWSLHYSRGIALERSDRWERAEKDFLQALEFLPEQPYVLNYLGYSWVEKGKNIARARAMIERAVKQRQNDGYIVDSMGWVLYRLGEYKKSVIHLERAAQLRPQDPVINDHLGDAYWRVGRRHEARFQWRRALSFKPEKKEVVNIERKLAKGLAKAEPVVKSDPGG